MTLPATDDFTGNDNDQLTDYSANWTLSLGDFHIQGNAVAPDTSSDQCGAYWNADAFDTDHYAEITIVGVAAGRYIGPAVRVTDSGNYYAYMGAAGDRYFGEVVNGSFSSFGDSTGVSASDVLRLEANGTTITPYLNGEVDTGVGGAVTDDTHGDGAAGICGYNTTATTRGDDWEGGNLSVEGSVTHLIDAVLGDTQTVTYVTDVNITSQTADSFSVWTVLSISKTQTCKVDSILKSVSVGVYSSDTRTEKQLVVNCVVDTRLLSTLDVSSILDVLLRTVGTSTYYIDANVEKVSVANCVVDVVTEDANKTQLCVIDAITQKQVTISTISYTVIKKENTSLFEVDAVLCKTSAVSVIVDASIKTVNTTLVATWTIAEKENNASSTIYTSLCETSIANAVTWFVTEKSLTDVFRIDAVLTSSSILHSTLDAVLKLSNQSVSSLMDVVSEKTTSVYCVVDTNLISAFKTTFVSTYVQLVKQNASVFTTDTNLMSEYVAEEIELEGEFITDMSLSGMFVLAVAVLGGFHISSSLNGKFHPALNLGGEHNTNINLGGEL